MVHGQEEELDDTEGCLSWRVGADDAVAAMTSLLLIDQISEAWALPAGSGTLGSSRIRVLPALWNVTGQRILPIHEADHHTQRVPHHIGSRVLDAPTLADLEGVQTHGSGNVDDRNQQQRWPI